MEQSAQGQTLPKSDGVLLAKKLMAIHSHAVIENDVSNSQVVYREEDVVNLLKEYGFTEPNWQEAARLTGGKQEEDIDEDLEMHLEDVYTEEGKGVLKANKHGQYTNAFENMVWRNITTEQTAGTVHVLRNPWNLINELRSYVDELMQAYDKITIQDIKQHYPQDNTYSELDIMEAGKDANIAPAKVDALMKRLCFKEPIREKIKIMELKEAIELIEKDEKIKEAVQLLLTEQRKICSEFADFMAKNREGEIVNGKPFGYNIFMTDIEGARSPLD